MGEHDDAWNEWARQYQQADPSLKKKLWSKLNKEQIEHVKTLGLKSPHRPNISTIRTKITGVTFKSRFGEPRQELVTRCSAGEQLTLIRQPDNPYDPNAIMICRFDDLGFLSKDIAADLAPLMDAGVVSVTATILDLTGGTQEKESTGLNIELEIERLDQRKARTGS